MGNLNRTMLLDAHGSDITTFCTVLLVFARKSERGFTLRLASAGHPPALLRDAAGRCSELTVAGPPAGWYEDAAFEEIEVDLRSGQTIVMYTDGLPEARSAGRLVGIERVIQALTRAGGSAEDAIAALRGVITAADVNVGDDVAARAFRAL